MGNIDERPHDVTARFIMPFFEAFELGQIVTRLHRAPKLRGVPELARSHSKFSKKNYNSIYSAILAFLSNAVYSDGNMFIISHNNSLGKCSAKLLS